jgi:hypothetical protein
MSGDLALKPAELLRPLERFLLREVRPIPHVRPISGHDVPEPYRRLLVGDHDMTPTLEAYYGETIHLRVLDRFIDEKTLSRLVVLTTDQSGRAVEFGAIDIHLPLFPPDAREAVIGCHMPLGTILSRFAVPHLSHPSAFLTVQPLDFIRDGLCIDSQPVTLYGRRNALTTPEGGVLADILEILPP